MRVGEYGEYRQTKWRGRCLCRAEEEDTDVRCLQEVRLGEHSSRILGMGEGDLSCGGVEKETEYGSYGEGGAA